MPRIVLKTKGVEAAEAFTARFQRGLARMSGSVAVVYSRMPYAYGIETGRHRVSGRVAHSAGGVWYLRRAVEDVLRDGRTDVSEGMEKVRAPGPWVLRRLARWARRLARKNAPRRTGRLRRSIQTEVRRRGA